MVKKLAITNELADWLRFLPSKWAPEFIAALWNHVVGWLGEGRYCEG